MFKYFPVFDLHKPHTGTKDQFLQKNPKFFGNVCITNWELVEGLRVERGSEAAARAETELARDVKRV